MKENKGIWYQIQEEVNKVTPNTEFKLSDLEELFEYLQEAEVKNRKKKKSIQKENNKHLVERSKELGKEIPFEVALMTDPYFNPSLMVSGEFLKKYKEWF